MIRTLIAASMAALMVLIIVSCESRKEEPAKSPPSVTQQEKISTAEPPRATAPAYEQPQPSEPAKTAVRPPVSSIITVAPFREPFDPKSFELASGALTVWRSYAPARPKLLLFASHPLLNPIPRELNAEIDRLIASASDRELLRRGSASASDTLLVSPQTVSAAINAKLVSELIVALPRKDKPSRDNLDKFKAMATSAGFLTAAEGAQLTLNGDAITGTVRGIPLRIVHQDALPKLDGPFVIHIDLSYFKELYVNEVKTPVYDLIHSFATSIRNAEYKPVAVTLSFSNQEVGIALSSRFVIRDIASLLRNPKYLQGGNPASWTRRGAAMYSAVMFNEGKAAELTEMAAKETPDDAAALFDLALLRLQHARTDEGFALLDQSVALDRGYALAYIELADRGQEMGKWRKSLDLLEKATKAFPDNDELRVRFAGDLIQRGRAPEARPILDQLLTRTWSAYYHPGIVETLGRMQEAAKVDSILPLPEEPEEASRQRVPSRGMPPSHMSIPMHKPPAGAQ